MSNNFPNIVPKGAIRAFVKFRNDLPAIVSNMAANTFKENFRNQGYEADGGGVVRWKKRQSGKKSSRGVLTKSGRLRRGIRPAPIPGVARVVNSVPYAQAHNEGFKGTVKVRGHKRYKYKNVKVKYKTRAGKTRNRTDQYKTNVTKVRAHTRKMNLEARPFMITTKPLLNRINKRVELGLQKIFNK